MGSHSTRLKRFRETLWLKQGARCHYCGLTLMLPDATIEHIVPRAFGGTDGLYNLTVICGSCNNGRGHGLHLTCDCRRCQYALQSFLDMRRGQRRAVQEVVYVGDSRQIGDVVDSLQRRKAKLVKRLAEDIDMDLETYLSCKVAAETLDSVIGMLTTPVPLAADLEVASS